MLYASVSVVCDRDGHNICCKGDLYDPGISS